MSDRIDDDARGSRQRLGSRLRAVHLKHVCGDVDRGFVGHVLELEVRVVDGFLKPSDEMGRGFGSQRSRKVLPASGATTPRGPMNF